jgi:hypothetical protein
VRRFSDKQTQSYKLIGRNFRQAPRHPQETNYCTRQGIANENGRKEQNQTEDSRYCSEMPDGALKNPQTRRFENEKIFSAICRRQTFTTLVMENFSLGNLQSLLSFWVRGKVGD